jgi:hypothetical protein
LRLDSGDLAFRNGTGKPADKDVNVAVHANEVAVKQVVNEISSTTLPNLLVKARAVANLRGVSHYFGDRVGKDFGRVAFDAVKFVSELDVVGGGHRYLVLLLCEGFRFKVNPYLLKVL